MKLKHNIRNYNAVYGERATTSKNIYKWINSGQLSANYSMFFRNRMCNLSRLCSNRMVLSLYTEYKN